VETGRISAHPGDIAELLNFYKVGADDHEVIMEAARLARQRGWWQEYGAALPDWSTILVDLEAAASVIRTYDIETIPALLQTEAYAAAALSASSDGRLERRVRLCLARQELLATDQPPHYRAVVNEAALHRRVGRPGVMREQLDHLLEAAARPHVTIQVLPLTAGAHAGFGCGSFVVLEFSEPTDPLVVYVDHLAGANYLEKEAETSLYMHTFEELCAAALDQHETAAFIAEVARTTQDRPAGT
jgi:Domain of unknown function (DUF5753)